MQAAPAAARARGAVAAPPLRAARLAPVRRAGRAWSRTLSTRGSTPLAAKDANGASDAAIDAAFSVADDALGSKAGAAAATAVAAVAGEAAAQEAAGHGPDGAAPPAPKSHPLALPEDMFGADELVQELTDTSSLGKRGELLLAAQMLAVLFILVPPFRLAGLFDLIATLALTAGLVFCVYGIISLGRNFSPLPAPRKNHKLVTSGLYAHLRHPIYGGLVLAALGLAAITRNEGRLALAVVLWAIVDRKAAHEEACLLQRYGAEYKSYLSRTRKFIPFLY